MSEHIRAVLSDIDATQIIPGLRFPSEEVQLAAQALRANNVTLLEVTSRSHARIRGLVEPLSLQNNLCVLNGGATIAHADSGEVVWSQWIEGQRVASIVKSVASLCTQVDYEPRLRHLKPLRHLQRIEDGEMVADAPSVFTVFKADKQAGVEEALAALGGLRHAPAARYGKEGRNLRCIQVTDAGVDKQTGVEQMLALSDLSAGQPLLAIGDGPGDIPLFRSVGPNGLKVAMGNAVDELKDLADWVAPSVYNHGFVAALMRYELI